MTELFVGREEQLAELDAQWALGCAGSARLVLLTAEAGMGKSALVRAWAATLAPPAQVVIVAGEEDEQALEFALLERIMRTPVARDLDPFAAGARLLGWFGERSEAGPVALVVDDIQASDPSTARALLFALRRLDQDPIVALVATRPVPSGGPVAGLDRLCVDRGARITLGGLEATEVSALAGATGRGPLPPRAVERLRALTGGSPLHLRALLAELSTADLTDPRIELPAPRSFAMLVASSLSRLPETAQRLGRAVAVLGSDVDVASAATVAALDGDGAAAVQSLEQAGLLVAQQVTGGWSLRWAHPLVRSAILHDLGAGDRAALHRRAAGVTGGTDQLRHLAAATLGVDEVLAERLEAQAEVALAQHGLGAAAELLLAARRLSGNRDAAGTRLVKAVSILLLRGDVAAAQPFADALADLPETSESLRVRAQLAWMAGDAATARSLGQRAWDASEPHDIALRVGLASMLAQLEILAGRPKTAVAWSGRVLSTPSLSEAQRSAARTGLVLALTMTGRVDLALAQVADLPEDPAAVPLARHGELRARGFAKLIGDDIGGAVHDLLTVAALIGRDPAPERLLALAGAAEGEYRLGEWTAAIGHAEQAVSLGEDAEQMWLLVFVHFVPVLILAARGQWAQAEHHLARITEVARLIDDEASHAYRADARVHFDLCRNDPAAAVQHAQPIMQGPHAAPREPGVMRLPVNYTSALVSLGRLDEADRTLGELDARARETGRVSRLCALARVRGELAAARRDTPGARVAFEAALEMQGCADALEAGLVHLSFGRFRRRRGERRAATEQLTLGREVFERLGAVPWVERCDAELALAGMQTAKATASPLTALTPKEQLVAELVCRGRTNREVAEDLVLSVKTVGYHLGNVYTKLGVHSRTQLAAHPAMPAGRSQPI
ncbi:LuxR C-terminal-related transcriptional regulator [Nostocoides sp. HKS02]|uniref:helix-turn-helix transcriptional regulator n=1 Tax=Nostocoides sp. HKS02 TaxID=1813880 RepID=UPI0012B4DAB8|nr:LuxR C-terminal-related transcriptional regulator [Tetrasphaera sp. HKS02]QGN58889.1 AAA family ATPase [Tetrasphaera sp. HKS02]